MSKPVFVFEALWKVTGEWFWFTNWLRAVFTRLAERNETWIQVLLRARTPPQGRAPGRQQAGQLGRCSKVLGGQVGRSRLLKVAGGGRLFFPHA